MGKFTNKNINLRGKKRDLLLEDRIEKEKVSTENLCFRYMNQKPAAKRMDSARVSNIKYQVLSTKYKAQRTKNHE